MWNYLNINWLLSRLLEKMGVETYLERTEVAAHVGWSLAFAFLGAYLTNGPDWKLWVGHGMQVGWFGWTLIDEFIVDGWKGKDTLWDLSSKLCGQVWYVWFIV